MNDESDTSIGKMVLGRYRIIRPLGRGGMGVVYLARSEGAAGFRRPVVVKRIVPTYSDNERLTKMFVREAKIMSRLRHPGIVGIIDLAEEDGAHVMVLEYIHGYDLSRWLRFIQAARGPFPFGLAVSVLIPVLDALAYAHDAKDGGTPYGVIHRDVTPSNVLIDIEGQVKLADFGIALASGELTEESTSDKRVKGKFSYLAPELFDSAPPSTSSDVYSVGVMLHELLVGRNEFRTGDVASTIRRVMKHDPTPPSVLREDVPPDIDHVIAQATAKHPEDRFANARAMAKALRSLRGFDDHEASRLLAEKAQQDFRDPAMVKMLRVPSLEELETAWNETFTGDEEDKEPLTTTKARVELDADGNPVGVTPSPKKYAISPLPKHDIVTVETTPDIRARRPPEKKSRSPLVYGLGLVAVAGLAVAATLYFTRPSAPPVVVVRGGDVEAVSEEEREPRPGDGASAVTEAIRQRGQDIHRCLSEHPIDLTRAADLALHLDIDADGNVSEAAVVPESLRDSDFGRCVEEVGRSIHFPARGEAVRVRIPLALSRGPRE